MLANAFLCNIQGKEPMSSRHLSRVGCYLGANLRRNGEVTALDLALHPYPPPMPHSHPGSLVGSAGLGKDTPGEDGCEGGWECPLAGKREKGWDEELWKGRPERGAGNLWTVSK